MRAVTTHNAPRLVTIYNYYVLKTVVTFEEEEVTSAEMVSRITTLTSDFPWFVYEEQTNIVGFAYAMHWKPRSAYRYSVETTAYLDPVVYGRGIGTELYSALLDELGRRSLHAAVGCIALPNPPSVALHEKLGFEKVAQFKQIGQKFNKWIDVGYWQKTLTT
ncbi:MAG: GNAT family N-acetyltransferase [Gammaproteobacteria bacterium]|nr:GNAT family N-acetyltransferase [Gammaproteobacteria bacterium]